MAAAPVQSRVQGGQTPESRSLQKSAANLRPPSLTAWLQTGRREMADATAPQATAPQALLSMLEASARNRWQVQPGPAPEADARTPSLQWRDEQGRLSTLRLEADGARWIEADGRHWFVPLDQPTLQDLRRAF